MRVIAITGATGFIGYHLLERLQIIDDIQIRILIHKNNSIRKFNGNNIKIIHGDLLDSKTLSEFVVPDCIVVNLGYLSGLSKQENTTAIQNLAEACVKVQIKRMIHCSTAVVVGRGAERNVDEKTICDPIDTYASIKLAVERILLEKYGDQFETAILRPTAVFGPGGKNLLKLANDLRYGSRITNYLKSCLFNYRRMNLVCIENVVSAIEFLINVEKKVEREIFIISDDDDISNNYRSIEKYLLKNFGYENYLLPIIPLPLIFLNIILRLNRRPFFNINKKYECKKILRSGYEKSILFDEGLFNFADWYKNKIFESESLNKR
jgi:nucleoside-diphosphate-sugar epimerase